MMSPKSLRIFDVRLCFIALNIARTFSTIDVIYSCRDNPIQYTSKFNFNCSNTNEVIYVESAIIGFTPLYKADRNVLQCPITNDTCANITQGPSTLCNGYNSCSLAQRILLYNESGFRCSIDSGGNWGGNFINVNYSCINPDLCDLLPGFKNRYTCSPKTTTSVSNHSTDPTSLSVTTAVSFSSGTTTNRSGQMTTIFALPSQTKGAIIGIILGAVISTIIVTSLAIGLLLLRRKKRRQARPEETTIGRNSSNIIDTNLVAYDQVAPIVFHTKATTRTRVMKDILTSEGKGNGYSDHRSVYEMAGDVMDYDTVRSSSLPMNTDNGTIENETVIYDVEKNNPDADTVEKKSDQVLPHTALNKKPVAQKRKTINNTAEPEYAEVRALGINYSSPSAQKNNFEGNYYNCTAVGMKEKGLSEMVDCSTGDRSYEDDEGDYVDWAPESECAFGEITLVDNDLYADKSSV